MSVVMLIDPLKDARWDKFVQEHAFGWIVHLSGWKKVIEQTFPHMKGYYFALIDKDTNAIKAGLPVYEIRSWLTGNRLVSIPFATLCDPLVSNVQQSEMLIAEAIRLMDQLKSSYIEIKTLNVSFLEDHESLSSNHDYRNHYIDLSKGEEALWKSIKNKTIGRWIKKAAKHNITYRVAQNEQDVHLFYRLYSETRKRLGLPAQPYLFFQELFDVFSESKIVEILFAVSGDRTIAGHLSFKFNRRVSIEAVGEDIAYRNIGVNHFLYWQEIRLACDAGYKTFDFGRTSTYNSSLMDFKQRWGTTEVDLCTYYYNHGQKAVGATPHETSMSYKLMRYICQNAPGPIQPVLSHFCYRHLG